MTDVTEAAAPAKISDLKPKMKLQGTVKKVELFGAFVDIGVGRDGLVHISALKRERVNKVDEVVQPGQEVTVWVRKVDPKAGRIDLTMVEPAAVEWNELQRGQVLTGKVVRMEKFGAFVDIGAERPGMVHIREMSNSRISDPSEIVKLGDEVDVKVLGVDPRKRQIDLSMKAVDIVLEAQEEPQEPSATAMELALRKAMGSDAPSGRKGGSQRKGGSRQTRSEQEDILARTLRNQQPGRKD